MLCRYFLPERVRETSLSYDLKQGSTGCSAKNVSGLYPSEVKNIDGCAHCPVNKLKWLRRYNSSNSSKLNKISWCTKKFNY